MRTGSDSVHGAASKPSLWFALLIAPIAPVRAVQRLDRLSMRWAWVTHALIAVLFVAIVALVGEASPEYTWDSFQDAQSLLQHRIEHRLNASDRPLRSALGTITAIVGSVEAGFLLLAALLAPRGARDEPLRHSYGASLRRVWLVSISLFWPILPLLVFDGWISSRAADWQKHHPEPDYRDFAVAGGLTEDPAELNRRRALFGNAWDDWNRLTPWYLRGAHAYVEAAIMLSGLWILSVLLRAAAAPRPVSSVARDPQCEACGYNLTGVGLDARCPECGMVATASLGAESRPGTPWSHRAELGVRRAWWRTFVMSLRAPDELGRRLNQSSDAGDCRSYALTWIPAIFVLGILGFTAPFVLEHRWWSYPIDGWMVAEFVATGTAAVSMAYGVTHAGACGIGWALSLASRRNMWPAAVQVSGYLVGLVAIGVVVYGLSLEWLAWFEWKFGWLPAIERAMEFPRILGPCIRWCVNVGMAVWFLWALTRGTGAARYANR